MVTFYGGQSCQSLYRANRNCNETVTNLNFVKIKLGTSSLLFLFTLLQLPFASFILGLNARKDFRVVIQPFTLPIVQIPVYKN